MDKQADMLRSESAPLLQGGSNNFGASPTSRKRRHSYELLPALQPGSRSAALRPRRHSSCDKLAFGVGFAKCSWSINSRQDGDQGLTSILEDRECGAGLDISKQSDPGGSSTGRQILIARRRSHGLVHYDSPLEVAVSNPSCHPRWRWIYPLQSSSCAEWSVAYSTTASIGCSQEKEVWSGHCSTTVCGSKDSW